MSSECRNVRITGQVQGVAYRAWAQSRAKQLGLTGWVRNEDDGSVTALVCGPKEAVEEMITACWQGPGAASVRDVQSERNEGPAPDGFDIRQ